MLACLLAAVIALAGCTTSTTGSGQGRPAAPSAAQRTTAPAPSRTSRTSSSPSASASEPTSVSASSAPASTAASAPATPHTPCPGAQAAALVTCLTHSLSTFWTAHLNTTVTVVAVANPTAAQVPAACRDGLQLHSAFTCPVGRSTVFLTRTFLDELQATPPTADFALRLAATMSHEAGHVVQFAVHEPLVEGMRGGDARSRRVEQQADCLSGVWAASVGIPDADFLRGATVVLTTVDNTTERRTHGTVAARLAAIRRGQAGKTPAACQLGGS